MSQPQIKLIDLLSLLGEEKGFEVSVRGRGEWLLFAKMDDRQPGPPLVWCHVRPSHIWLSYERLIGPEIVYEPSITIRKHDLNILDKFTDFLNLHDRYKF